MTTARVRPIGGLPLAGQLDGSEVLPGVQGGAAVGITAQKLADRAAGLVPIQGGVIESGQFISRPSKIQIQGPGSTGPIDGMSVTAPGTGGTTRTLSDRLRDLPVYPQDYGAKYDGSTNDRVAHQTAADIAGATGRPLHIGGENLGVIDAPIVLNGVRSIIGDGEGRSILVGVHNGPIFVWNVNGANVDRFLVSGFTLRGQFASDADYSLSRGFLIQGDNTAWFQNGRFVNLTCEGLYAGFEINKATFTTSFGQESRTGFITFDNVSIGGGSRPAHYGWYFPKGSGTGHTWTNIKTAMGDSTSAVFRFEGSGAVVGDIVIGSGHYGGNGSKLVSIGPGTVYRRNIMVAGSQLDAGILTAFDLDPTGIPYGNVLYAGNNVGGGVAPFGVAGAPVVNSIIDERDVSSYRASNYKVFAGSAGLVVPVFSIKLSASAYGTALFTGVSCRLVASGLVGSVDASVVDGTFLIRTAGGTVSASLGAAPMKAPAGGFDLSVTVSGSVATLNVVLPAGASGQSFFDAQISCTGGAGLVVTPL